MAVKYDADLLVQDSPGTLAPCNAARCTVAALESALLERFPAQDAEEWDRTGLLVGDPSAELRKVLTALDPTLDAIWRAHEIGAQALVTHHPLYLNPPQSITPDFSRSGVTGAAAWLAAKLDVALLCFHTALDVSAEAAVYLPLMIGLAPQNAYLQPLEREAEKGYGRICRPMAADGSLSLDELASRCEAAFGRPPRVWGEGSRALERIAVCSGSASDFVALALEAQMDCLVCGEVKYHTALDALQRGLAIIELGHDCSELPYARLLADAIRVTNLPLEDVVVLDQGGNWHCPQVVSEIKECFDEHQL